MVTHELHSLGAADTAGLIARGEISALAVAEARIAVIERCNPQVNAVVARRYDAAREEARAVDRARERGEALPPLAGVPVTIKEALDVAGLASTSGAPARAAHLAEADCDAVARLRRAGAIVLGKTNVAQGLVFVETDNPLFGRCNHPENPERTPGGSSGGEGAVIAFGGSALGLGTDIGGSGRIPAAFCGIASLKPTAGRVSDTQRLSVPIGAQAIASQIVPMARNVADVELALSVLNPPHLMLGRSADVDVRRLRVGVIEHDGVFAPSPGVRRVVREAAATLKAAGSQVLPFTIPDGEAVRRVFYGLLSADGIAGLKRTLAGGGIDARVKQLMIVAGLPRAVRHGVAALAGAAGQRHLPALLRALGRQSTDGYWRLVQEQLDYQARFVAAMDSAGGGAGRGLDLLLGPVMPTPAFRHGATKDLGVPGIYTSLYNLLGWPAGVVPCSRVRQGEESDRQGGKDIAERAAAATEAGSAGLPLAVQVAARPWCEPQALAAMRVIEAGVARAP
jgi:fatty acid amide hydrolase